MKKTYEVKDLIEAIKKRIEWWEHEKLRAIQQTRSLVGRAIEKKVIDLQIEEYKQLLKMWKTWFKG